MQQFAGTINDPQTKGVTYSVHVDFNEENTPEHVYVLDGCHQLADFPFNHPDKGDSLSLAAQILVYKQVNNIEISLPEDYSEVIDWGDTNDQ